MSILEVKNVSKKFKNVRVMEDISFEVNEGETLVILGPSGSGKSTLLRCIAGLEKIDSGNIIIDKKAFVKEYKKNKPIYNDKNILKEINLSTGMVFQDFNLFPHLTAKENITEALIYVLNMSKEDANNKAISLLKKMGLEDKENVYPCNLSGGQKQRVSIARCLAIEPKLICMDEPTSALDPELVGEVLKVIKKLSKEKKTMVIVTHEIKFAEEVADRIIFMDEGRIIEEGTPDELIKNPKNERTQNFLKRYIPIKERKMERLDINKIEPKEVLKFFEEISKIPRESGNEKGIKNYLVDFAKKRNFKVIEDKNFNVIITKEADKKFSKLPPIAFQAHTDMICEKNENVKHDFSKDPILLYKENDFIKANGTTLGADNGIGVAIILALLDSKNIPSPKIEAIFTVQEETTMIGAKDIDLSSIESKKIISLDGGKEGKILVGSANCLEWISEIKKEYIDVPKDYFSYELIYSNFKGGHSGGNIGDIKRGNPIKLGIDILKKAKDVYITELFGGSRVNVIPRNFIIRFITKKNKINIIEKLIAEQKDFFGPDVIIELKESSKGAKVLSKKISDNIINFIYNYENGALSYDENSNILLSCNMATVNETKDAIQIGYSTRSNNMDLRNTYLEKLEKLVNKYNLEITWSQELKGVEQNIDNELIKICNTVYKNVYEKDLEKMITQGVVEGGFFAEKIKDLQYVCIGPNTQDVHSPNERVSITSLQNTWNYLKKILEYLTQNK